MKKQDNFFLILLCSAILLAGLAGGLTLIRSPQNLQKEAQTKKLETQGTSDEVSAIEEDLTVTDLSSLDKELKDIELELNATQ